MPKIPVLSALVVPAVVLAAGCTAARHEVQLPVPAPCCRGVVFAVDGAGDFEATSHSLRDAVADTGLPLFVETFDWSHGYGRILSDQMDWKHSCSEGRRLACEVAAYRRNNPQAEIYLVGHSAGTAVVLTAAENLPAASVDRIVLLAPSVSADYDLRPALCCARKGVDVFCSSRDIGYLGLGIVLFGTADRHWGCPAAGRHGFRPVVKCAGDAALYGKLTQHPWDPCVAWTGNNGGHYGGYQPGFLRAFVLPLLTPG